VPEASLGSPYRTYVDILLVMSRRSLKASAAFGIGPTWEVQGLNRDAGQRLRPTIYSCLNIGGAGGGDRAQVTITELSERCHYKLWDGCKSSAGSATRVDPAKDLVPSGLASLRPRIGRAKSGAPMKSAACVQRLSALPSLIQEHDQAERLLMSPTDPNHCLSHGPLFSYSRFGAGSTWLRVNEAGSPSASPSRTDPVDLSLLGCRRRGRAGGLEWSINAEVRTYSRKHCAVDLPPSDSGVVLVHIISDRFRSSAMTAIGARYRRRLLTTAAGRVAEPFQDLAQSRGCAVPMIGAVFVML